MLTCRDVHPRDKVLVETFSNACRRTEEIKIVAENYVITAEGNKYGYCALKEIIE